LADSLPATTKMIGICPLAVMRNCPGDGQPDHGM
jgi:hypothetical protein